MSVEHPDVGPELQQLAAKILAMLDPLIQAAKAIPSADGEPGRCQQVWCPFCAIAAVASGEHHPLIAVVADHSAALLSLLHATVSAPTAGTPSPDPPSRYEHIDVTIID